MRILLLILIAGCAEEQSKFPVVITAVTDDGTPMPELPILLGKANAGRTDADGKLRVRVTGREGQRIQVSTVAPEGYKLGPSAQPLVLRRLADIEGGTSRPLPVEHTIKLSPLSRKYAVLVRAGFSGLAIETFGTQQAVTNSKGVAMFLYTGSPGDELQVKINTATRPDLRPQNPISSFLLAQKAEAYVVKEQFTVFRAPVKKHKPVHLGPKRL
jgi:hypothetical protein